jgi:DNA-binding NarL/FixJ family response regulator
MADSRTISVLLVDDHHLFREGLRAVVADAEDIVVCGEASTGREAFEMVDRLKPDVVTVDVTMHGNHYYVSQALSAGAKGYALKEQRPTEILEALRAVARGETYVAPQLPQELGAAPTGTRRGNGATNPLDTLSPRERDIFDLIVRGYTNTSMAETLQLSVKTIETHRAHINKKLRVHSTGELIRLAALHGLVAT